MKADAAGTRTTRTSRAETHEERARSHLVSEVLDLNGEHDTDRRVAGCERDGTVGHPAQAQKVCTSSPSSGHSKVLPWGRP